jgi:Zn finger protein HypA/HybF involved in hydrogenase expression
MHEVGLLAAAIAELAAAAGGSPVERVELALGPGVDPQVARQGWTQAARGSVAEAAAVTWTRVLDTLVCLGCGHEYAGEHLSVCPRCGGDGLVVVAVPEIDILGWELAAPCV